MPTNFMHVGFIRTMFPNAKIIHCTRNPIDTCLSCYFQDFGRNHPWLYKLDDIIDFYKNYKKLMMHWNNIPEIDIYEVEYENFIYDQEYATKNLIEHLGIEWNEKCLDFHKNQRLVWTASYEQVRQPVYSHSIERWRNYSAHIKSLIDEFNS